MPAFSARMSGRTSARMRRRGGLVGHVGGNRRDAQPGADGLKRIGVAGDNRHACVVRDQGLHQPQAKAAASAGDDNTFVFEAHRFCSCV